MATRKDLLKAQAFTSRRMIASFINRDPDDPTPPLRRVGMASFVSLMIAIIMVAGYTLIGLLRPGSNPGWKTGGVVISDTQAGALFIYHEGQDMLQPVADVATARLLAGGLDAAGMPRTTNVKTDALVGMKQADMRGIPGAPRQLPDAANMSGYPIKMCSTAPNNNSERFVTLEFRAETPASDNFAFVAEHSDNSRYLIFNGKKHRLWDLPERNALMSSGLPAVAVGNAWIAAIPEGVPIAPLQIDAPKSDNNKFLSGMARADVARTRNADDAGQRQYFTQTEEGLVRISYLDAEALLLLHHNGDTNAVRQLDPSDMAKFRNAPDRRTPGLPWDEPRGPSKEASLRDVSVCATWLSADDEVPVLSYGDKTPDFDRSLYKINAGNTFDIIQMAPLTGALLRNSQAQSDTPVTFLVTNGRKYAIPDQASRAALGYKDVQPVAVPGGFLAQIPEGLPERSSLSNSSITIIRPDVPTRER